MMKLRKFGPATKRRAEMAPRRVAGPFAIVVSAVVFALVPTRAAPQPPQPALPTPAQLLAGEPMHIEVVRGLGPACDPNCPMWIAAVGKITPGTAEKLRRVIQSLAGRRLPILVNSPGGFIDEAMAMGRLIRRDGLSVAVADTSLTECLPASKNCELRASTSLKAICASACTLVLAGGIRRYVSDYSFVGVHELMTLHTITHTMRKYEIFYRSVGGRKEEISRRLLSDESSTSSAVSQASADINRSAANYFAEMGVGEPALSLTFTTPSISIRRLSRTELRDSLLATHLLKGPSPIGASAGLNGLQATSIYNWATGDLLAYGARPLELGDGRAAEINMQFTYRPAGGNARLDLVVSNPGTKEPVLAGKNGVLLVFRSEGPAFAALPRTDQRLTMIFPLKLFCQLRGAQAATLILFDNEAGSEGAWPPVPFDIDALAGAKPLLDETCPALDSTVTTVDPNPRTGCSSGSPSAASARPRRGCRSIP
jgi:hypothetical protein